MKNLQLKSNVWFVENQYLEILMSIYIFMGSCWLVSTCPFKKIAKKKIISAFRIEISWILMAADLASQIGWVQAFFLRKYLFLSQFLNLKTPTDDSRPCHWRDFKTSLFIKEGFACRYITRNINFRWIFFLNFRMHFKRLFCSKSMLYYLIFDWKI